MKSQIEADSCCSALLPHITTSASSEKAHLWHFTSLVWNQTSISRERGSNIVRWPDTYWDVFKTIVHFCIEKLLKQEEYRKDINIELDKWYDENINIESENDSSENSDKDSDEDSFDIWRITHFEKWLEWV
jgi:hypothetical protein